MKAITIRVNTVGSAGSAVGSGLSDEFVTGYIEAIKLDYNASAPATTDTNLNESDGLGRTLLTIANSSTDAIYYPRQFVHNPSGTASTTNVTRYYVNQVRLQIAVAGCDALTDAVVATVLISGV